LPSSIFFLPLASPSSHQLSLFFFFNHPATPEIFTLSLHDALPILAPLPTISFAGVHPLGWTGGACRIAPLPGVLPFKHNRTGSRSEEHTSELQSLTNLVCRLLLEKKKTEQHRRKLSNTDASQQHHT